MQFYDKRAFSDRAMNGLMNVFYFLGSGGFFPLILFLRLSDEPFYLFFSCLSYFHLHIIRMSLVVFCFSLVMR